MPPRGSSTASAATGDVDVPFETLGIVSSTSGINLAEPAMLAIRSTYDVGSARDLLATGYDESFADDVIATIGEIPPDRVVLVGVIDASCTAATDAGLVRDKSGELTMYAPGHVPEPIECVVAVLTVAVLSVNAAAVPVGAADHAELVAFEHTGFAVPPGPTAVEITHDERRLLDILPAGADVPDLSPRDAGARRFAFVRAGCRNTTAEMVVTPQLLDVRLGYDEHGETIACDAAEFFLAVFDVPAQGVRDTATLVGG